MFVLAVVTSYTIRGENNRNVSPEFTIFVIPLKNIVMSDLEIIRERFLQQDRMIDLLRMRISALENLLKKNIPNFEGQYATELTKVEIEFENRKVENLSEKEDH